jgi:hypothetical protein
MTREKYHGGHGDVRRTLQCVAVLPPLAERADLGRKRISQWLIVPALGGAHQLEAPGSSPTGKVFKNLSWNYGQGDIQKT